MQVSVDAKMEDGHTLAQFCNLIEQRKKWLNESTEDAVAACAIDLLKSLRAATVIANFRKTKIAVEDMTSLKLSYYSLGKGATAKKIPCLRNGHIRYIPPKGISIRFKSLDKVARVYKFVYNSLNGKNRTYLIVANSSKDAAAEAKEIVKKRTEMYKGLAKRAIGQLMFKACTLNPVDAVSADVEKVAKQQTTVSKNISKTDQTGRYSLTLHDKLVYAVLALKNGSSDIQSSFMKASNKVASIINTKCKNLLGFTKIDSPFPEVKGKKR